MKIVAARVEGWGVATYTAQGGQVWKYTCPPGTRWVSAQISGNTVICTAENGQVHIVSEYGTLIQIIQ